MEAGGHAFSENDEVGTDAKGTEVEDFRTPKSGLDFVDAHEGAGGIATFARELEVRGVNGDGFAVHEDGFGPEAGDAVAVFFEGGFECVGVVGFNASDFAALDEAGPHAAHELGEHVAAVIVAFDGNNDGDCIGAMVFLEDFELNFQGGGTGDRTGAKTEMDFVERIGFAGGVGERNEAMRKLFEWSLGDVGVVVPDDSGLRGFARGFREFGMVVAPEHLIVAGGAIEEKAALFAEIEQTAPDEEIIAGSGLATAVGIGQSRFVDGGCPRDFVDNRTDAIDEFGLSGRFEEARAGFHGGDDLAAVGTEQCGEAILHSGKNLAEGNRGEKIFDF